MKTVAFAVVARSAAADLVIVARVVILRSADLVYPVLLECLGVEVVFAMIAILLLSVETIVMEF